MKVFISGGTGFIGSNVVRRFLEGNAEIHILARKSSNLWRIQDIEDQINLHYGDLSSSPVLERIISTIGPDVVINCSGIVKGFSLGDQDLVIQSNLVNTVNLVNASIKSKVDTLIHTGSAYECGFSQHPITNMNCEGSPIGLYGVIKRAESEYIKLVSKSYSKKYINFRLFTPYGFFDSPFRLIPYVIISLIFGKVPDINNPNAGRSFVFIRDVANIYYATAKNSERLNGISSVNLGTQDLVKVSELTSLLYQFFGLDYTSGGRNGDACNEYLYPDSKEVTDLLSSLSIKLTPLQDGLARTVKWFRDNMHFYDKKLLTEKGRPN